MDDVICCVCGCVIERKDNISKSNHKRRKTCSNKCKKIHLKKTIIDVRYCRYCGGEIEKEDLSPSVYRRRNYCRDHIGIARKLNWREKKENNYYKSSSETKAEERYWRMRFLERETEIYLKLLKEARLAGWNV